MSKRLVRVKRIGKARGSTLTPPLWKGYQMGNCRVGPLALVGRTVMVRRCNLIVSL